jgi:putative FmdB family regulatory protein
MGEVYHCGGSNLDRALPELTQSNAAPRINLKEIFLTNFSEPMPLYEYECEKCGHRFEKIQKFSDRMVKKCPKCGGKVEQMISAPAVQFKGSGWYVTDYANKSQAPASDSGKDSKNEDKSKSDASSKDSSAKQSSSTESSSKEKSSKESSSKESSAKESTHRESTHRVSSSRKPDKRR